MVDVKYLPPIQATFDHRCHWTYDAMEDSHRGFTTSHQGTSTSRQSSIFGGCLGRRPSNVFNDFIHELARRSRTLGVPITAEILSDFQTLPAERKLAAKLGWGHHGPPKNTP